MIFVTLAGGRTVCSLLWYRMVPVSASIKITLGVVMAREAWAFFDLSEPEPLFCAYRGKIWQYCG